MAIYNLLNNTMVVERVAGVGVYTLFLVGAYLLLMNANTAKRVNFVFNIYLIVLCVMAFFYVPGRNADLWRIWSNGKSWVKMDFYTFFTTNVVKSANPAANLFIYICSATGIDGVLPMTCALIYYGNAFYIFKNLYNRHQYSARSLALSLFFLMATGNFLVIISNVRTFTAMSILARCFYDEAMNGKSPSRHAVWYLIAALIHGVVLIACGLRFAWLMFARANNVQKKTRNVVIAIVTFGGAYLFGKDYIDAAMYKATGYLNGEVYSYIWSYFISGILAVVVFCTCIGSHQNTSIELRNIRGYTVIIMSIACIFAFEYSIFHRLSLFASLLVIPYLAKRIDSAKKKNFEIFVFLCSLAMLAISVTRGDLSGYKFFLTSW